jgi:hypothetical protein
MSLHAFSNLAVLDITDESAAIQSGGVSFRGADGDGGTGIVSPFTANGTNPTILPDNSPIGSVIKSYRFIGDLSVANNRLNSFASFNAGSATYSATFFDGTNFDVANLGSFGSLNASKNGQFQNLGSRNRTGSVIITRTA